MADALLTWKEEQRDRDGKPAWPDYRENAARTREGTAVRKRWTVGKHTHIQPGDRVFVMKQGKGKTGIVAAGKALTTCCAEPDFRDPKKTSNVIDVELVQVLNDNHSPLLAVKGLADSLLETVNWDTQRSGIPLEPAVADRLQFAWDEHVRQVRTLPAPSSGAPRAG